MLIVQNSSLSFKSGGSHVVMFAGLVLAYLEAGWFRRTVLAHGRQFSGALVITQVLLLTSQFGRLSAQK